MAALSRSSRSPRNASTFYSAQYVAPTAAAAGNFLGLSNPAPAVSNGVTSGVPNGVDPDTWNRLDATQRDAIKAAMAGSAEPPF